MRLGNLQELEGVLSLQSLAPVHRIIGPSHFQVTLYFRVSLREVHQRLVAVDAGLRVFDHPPETIVGYRSFWIGFGRRQEPRNVGLDNLGRKIWIPERR